MSAKVAVIAALPREIAGLVGGAKADPALMRQGISLYAVRNAVVVSAGMGAARVAVAFGAAVSAANGLEEVVSVGLAGACAPELAPGVAIEAGVVIDASTGEQYETAAGSSGPVLVSVASIASVQEKARLFATYGAAAVDMEAATVARLALAHGLRFRAVKGISDAHHFELESLGRFTGPRGEFRTAAFALHTALRPGTWGVAAALGRNSKRALAAMNERLTKTGGVRAIAGSAS